MDLGSDLGQIPFRSLLQLLLPLLIPDCILESAPSAHGLEGTGLGGRGSPLLTPGALHTR